MTVVMPQRNKEISDKIEQSILKKEEIPLWEELLLNSEQYFYQAEYRHSILESIIALELVISEFVRKKCREQEISNEDAKRFIKDIGLTGNLKVTLKLLLKDENLPGQEVIEKCKASITFRNDIVHEGRNDISKVNAEDALKYSKKLIRFLVSFL